MTRGAALVCTHHLFEWAGSELVAIELVEALRDRGIPVTVFSPFADPDFTADALPSDVPVLTDPGKVRLADHALIYTQHQAHVPVYAAQDWMAPGARAPIPEALPVLVCAHLSPWEPLEFPGPVLEPAAADIVLANSPETAARLQGFGVLDQPVALWRNPAPATFEGIAAPPPGDGPPRRLLVVSNHLPPEMEAALDLLSTQGADVTRLGKPGPTRRVRPRDLRAADAVVTIGKTVQYALRSRRPVFCYDRFGGPGWLGEGNFDAAADANFSGRCTRAPRDAETLAREIATGFAAAHAFAAGIHAARLAPFALEGQLDALLDQVAMATPRLRTALRDDPDRLRARADHEAALFRLVDRHYGNERRHRTRVDQLTGTVGDLRGRLAAAEERRRVLRDRNATLRAEIDTLRARLKEGETR